MGHYKPGVYLGELNRDALSAAFEHDPSFPGKFEGERAETVYYYHCMLDGDGETIYSEHEEGGEECYESEAQGTVFEITKAERRMFPNLTDEYYIIWYSSQGFVYGEETDENPIED